jgi:hypothetical protein
MAASGLEAQTNQGTDFWLAETSNLGCRGSFAIAIANPNAGTPIDNIIINQGEYFQQVNDPDMTGWSVVTDKPAAVFTGSRCTALGTSRNFCDHLDEQVFPEKALAATFVACLSLTRPIVCNPATPGSCSPDHFRYVATEDNTTISTSPGVVAGVIDAGQFLQIDTATPHIVQADKPIYGYQYLISQDSGPPTASTGDPALFGIPPVEQFQFDYIFLTPNSYAFEFINVVAIDLQ